MRDSLAGVGFRGRNDGGVCDWICDSGGDCADWGGGWTITAPLLILFLHVPLEIAVSTALAYSAIVKLIVVPFQVARRQVSWKVLGWMLVGGLPGVVIGSLFFKHVAKHGPKELLSFALGAIILFTAGGGNWFGTSGRRGFRGLRGIGRDGWAR